MDASLTRVSLGLVHTVEPTARHTHTAILLHGRGSNGPEFADELFESRPSSGESLAQKLPGWRWVFPSSREMWSMAFEEQIPAWFEAHSLADVTARQDLQVVGITESVRDIKAIVDEEIERLGGTAERLVLGGISQGAAIGLWTLLCQNNISRRLGAFVGASAWLPFFTTINDLLCDCEESVHTDNQQALSVETTDAGLFVGSMMAPLRRTLRSGHGHASLLATPIFSGHGTDDAYVDVGLGRQARDALTRIGFNVTWKEYSGAEQEGHWLKEPEQVEDIANFMLAIPG